MKKKKQPVNPGAKLPGENEDPFLEQDLPGAKDERDESPPGKPGEEPENKHDPEPPPVEERSEKI